MPHHPSGPEPSGKASADISALVDDLSPVAPMRPQTGLVLTIAATLLALVIVAWSMGIREDLADLAPHRMFMLRATALMALGAGATWTALASALPGRPSHAGTLLRWILALVALIPLAGLMTLAMMPVHDAASLQTMLDPQFGLECLRVSAGCALAVAVPLTLWVRRGAPGSPERAAWLIGLASGALGAAAYSVHCAENQIAYIGTWYTLAILSCAVAGRIILPPVLRW